MDSFLATNRVWRRREGLPQTCLRESKLECKKGSEKLVIWEETVLLGREGAASKDG